MNLKGIACQNLDYYQRLGESNIQTTWVICSGCKKSNLMIVLHFSIAKYNHTLSFYVKQSLRHAKDWGYELQIQKRHSNACYEAPSASFNKKSTNKFVDDPQNFTKKRLWELSFCHAYSSTVF